MLERKQGIPECRIARTSTAQGLLLSTSGGGAGQLLAVGVQQTLVQLPGVRIPDWVRIVQ